MFFFAKPVYVFDIVFLSINYLRVYTGQLQMERRQRYFDEAFLTSLIHVDVEGKTDCTRSCMVCDLDSGARVNSRQREVHIADKGPTYEVVVGPRWIKFYGYLCIG